MSESDRDPVLHRQGPFLEFLEAIEKAAAVRTLESLARTWSTRCLSVRLLDLTGQRVRARRAVAVQLDREVVDRQASRVDEGADGAVADEVAGGRRRIAARSSASSGV